VVYTGGGEVGSCVLWGGLVVRYSRMEGVKYVADAWACAEEDECSCHFSFGV
jgi:hypothetical protein